MADDRDPRTVEEQSQAEQENHKVYKRRWLVLFAMFSVILVVGLHRCLISIADKLETFMGITIDDYDLMAQVSMYTILFSVLAMARALDYFGLRRIVSWMSRVPLNVTYIDPNHFIFPLILTLVLQAYVACVMIICANGLKVLCCCDEKYVSPWIKRHRFHILLVSEVFVGLAQSISVCVPAKVAGSWFAHYESTLAMVIANCGFNIGIGFSNYFTPIFIASAEDIYKLCYMFILSGVLVTVIVLTCVTRSSPKMPPSPSTVTTASNIVPLKKGLTVMLSDRSYVLLLITLSMNLSALGVTQFVLEDILQTQHYSNSFCGTLIAHAYFFGTFFMLMGAAWVDNSANYVKVSRIASIICALSIATFNMSIILPNIKNVILVTNVMASFGCSLMYPALFQVCLRGAATILPEATVAAITIVLQQILSGVLMNLFGPLKKISTTPGGYQAPMIIFACLVVTMNFLYVTSFKPSSRAELQTHLRNLGGRDVLVNCDSQ